ncbi:hypothetical protein SCB49_09680 [unidentified eubacterium SCB49]|nr:hypothetical protein SCB49_09680 [unidentified eubacterium SCB49]
MMFIRIFLTFIFLLANLTLFGQEIDASSYYQIYNLHQGSGMVMAYSAENSKAIMTQNIPFEGKLWKFEPTDSGYYYIKNYELGAKGYLHSLKDKNVLVLSENMKDDRFKWKFEKREYGLNFINKYYGDNVVIDCDSKPTGSNMYLTKISGTSGQFWFFTKVLKLPFTITSLRIYDSENTIILGRYPLSAVTALITKIETQGKILLDEKISPEIFLEAPYSVVIEYVKGEKLYTKKYNYGETINIIDF